MERTMSRGVLRLSVLGTLVLSLIAALPAAVDAEKPVEGLKNLEGEHSGENGEKKGQFMDSFLQTTALVIFSEIGDKTFLIAAILAMKHPRKVIFLASCTSLWLMSYLSAVLGNMMVKMIPLRMVSTLAGVMFLVFALKMYFEAKEMKNDAVLDEMKEIQEELEEKLDGEKINEFDTKDDYNVVVDVISHEIETSQEEKQGLGMSGKDTQENDGLSKAANVSGLRTTTDSEDPVEHLKVKLRTKVLTPVRNLLVLLLSPIFVEVFVLVFLAEWGDRSQLAIIALGASQEVWSVTLGTIIGHSVCTFMAVIGGKLLAEKISVKKLTFAGSVLFLLFGLLYLYKSFSS